MSSNHIILDEDAERLFSELGGLSDRVPVRAYGGSNGDSELDKAEAALDQARLYMIQLTHQIAAFFVATHFLQGMKTGRDEMTELTDALNKLARLPHRDGRLLVRFRGFPTGTNVPPENDYVIRLDDLEIDAAQGAALSNRMGVQMSHLSGRLAKAFKVLADHGISTLSVSIPPGPQQPSGPFCQRLRACLQIISRYGDARKRRTDIEFEVKGQTKTLPPIPDESGRPDFNLTLLAGLNDMSAESMAALVRRVDGWMKRTSANPFFGVYDAIFGLRQLKGKLFKPPIEVNNIKWLAMEGRRQTQSPAEAAQKAQVARLAGHHFDAAPHQAARSLQAVYGEDYDQVNAPKLAQRLHHASQLLTAAEKDGSSARIEKEVLRNIRDRFEQVKDDVFDNLAVSREGIKLRSADGKESTVEPVNGKLSRLLAGHKGRLRTQQKMKNLVRQPMTFDERDYRAVAQEFRITAESARDLVGLLKQCFDNKGHFLRSVFERFIPAFATHEKKVFGFLWHYLKETPHRSDRVAFLNSLQLLISKMKEPVFAIEMLLKDVLRDPDRIDFSDRNAFMLSNILVRTYNKEMDIDIELTPEEVLAVQNGLDRKVAAAMARWIDGKQSTFLRKIRTIHSQLNRGMAGEKTLPVRFLLSMEREIYIFLSLVGGTTARAVLRSALKTYGSADAAIYRMPESHGQSEALLQHLTVVIRGVGRIGQNHDLPSLHQVKEHRTGFGRLWEGPRTTAKVQRLMHWVDVSEKKLHPDMGGGRISYLMAAGTANASAI